MFCREHAAQVRGRYDEIREAGGDVVAIGTGDVRYARAFVDQDDIPFLVLVDDHGEAARAASVRRGSAVDLMGPANWGGALRATFRGHRQRRTGKRADQLGATFVIAPSDDILYAHRANDAADNPPLDDVIGALRSAD